VALAAVKLAHEAAGVVPDDDEIPQVTAGTDRPPRPAGATRPARPARGPSAGMTKLFVGAGRSAGIRPQDIVGAIAGETRLSGRDIGAIEIADRFTLVEVPEQAADEVVAALKASTIKGKKATIRRAHEDR
jgi:ATP-dependent RNA helicase DeaD